MQKLLHVVVMISLALPCAAFGSQRHALIIGNDAYPLVPLKNARNDATAVNSALGSVGYDTTLLLDVNRNALEQGVDSFVAKLSEGDVAIVYYAGHGMQVDGENYLIPIDFSANTKVSGKAQGYSLSELLQKVQSHGASTQIVILDACRDNPFLGTRSLHGGWAGISTSAGSFLAFGTSPGSTAADSSTGSHGTFTASLLKYLTTSQLDIEQTFQLVRADVISSSGGHQVPWTASSLIGSFHIVPSLDKAAASLPRSFPTRPSSISVNSDQSAGSGSLARAVRLTSNAGTVHSVRGEVPTTPVTQSTPGATSTSGSNSSTTTVPSPADTSTVSATLLANSLQEIQAGHYPDAERGLEALLALDPRAELAAQLVSLILNHLGKNHEAVRVLDRSISLNPTSAHLYYDRCIVGASLNPTLAVSDCLEALTLEPTIPDGHNGLAQAYVATGSFAKALNELQSAASANESAAITASIQKTVNIMNQSPR